MRHQEQVLRQYVTTAKAYGNVPGVRGDPWLVAPRKEGDPFLAITFGTLSRALYLAREEDPENPLIQESFRRGLKGCMIFEPDIPNDVVIWLRDWHNSWHSGSGVTFLELLQRIPTIDASWSNYASDRGWTWRGSGTGENSFEGKRFTYVKATVF